MVYCLNPACAVPENSGNSHFCQSCGVPLNAAYVFRDRYRILEILGQGAFGRTYKVEDIERFNHPCVIKKFIAQGQGSALEKAKELFEREAKRLYHLNHPQIPSLYAYFQQQGSLYLVQEFVEGENLFEEFRRRGRYSEAEIREILSSLLPVLQYLHQQNPPIIHRDIKPDNIMRRRTDNQLVLIDFGGAKQIAGTSFLSNPGTIVYTPGYGAFEQIQGKARPTSDLYSLGATCVRLLTGCFPQKTSKGIQDELYDSDSGRWLWQDYLQRRGVTVSDELGEVLDRLLKHFPQSRYQSAEEVLAALRVQPKQQVPAPPPPKPQPQARTTPPPQPNPNPVSPTPVQFPVNLPSPSPGGKVTRAKFLKWLGFGSVGVIVSIVAGSLLSRESDNLTPEEQEIFESPPEEQEVFEALNATDTFDFEWVTVDNKGQIVNRRQGQADFFPEDLGNGVTLEMVAIPGGSFMMGSPETEEGRDDDESPQHRVTISPFFMGKHAVTQEQWKAVAALPKIERDLDPDPSNFKGAKRPVEWVSWYDAEEFCKRLSKQTGREYRLPSEAEWEYVCRAGTTTPFHFGETITPDLVNYDGNDTYANAPKGEYREETIEVGSFPPNAFGLYDMHGNVWEWCADYWHESYNGAPNDGTIWLRSDEDAARLLRGGSWLNGPWDCRSAYRDWFNPGVRFTYIGFRVVGVAART